MPPRSPRAVLMRSPPKNKRRCLSATVKKSDIGETPDERKRLACPFFQRQPKKTRPSCVYPGFSSIPRLKEHLYRQHMLPQNLCPRCLETFKRESELRKHARALSPCPVNTETHIEGITLEQEKALKSKKRTGSKTAEEKWQDIYSILFPDEDIPDAFCRTTCSDDLMKDTLSLIERELPEFLAQRLKEASSELSPFKLEDPVPRITGILSEFMDQVARKSMPMGSASNNSAFLHTNGSSAPSESVIAPSRMPSAMSTSSRRQVESPSSFQNVPSNHLSTSDLCLTISPNPEPEHVSPNSHDARLDPTRAPMEGETSEQAAELGLSSALGGDTDYRLDSIFNFDLWE